jgi:ribonuclease HII
MIGERPDRKGPIAGLWNAQRIARGGIRMAGGGRKADRKGAAARTSGPIKRQEVPTLEMEEAAWRRGTAIIAGIDEAGRGPLAGPVVAAAVVLDHGCIPDGITDSKKLTAQQREHLFDQILATADVGIAISDPEQIDRDNILAATLDAMRRAVLELKSPPALALVDGNRSPRLACECITVVKGDLTSMSIAAASIMAKVSRDRIMTRLDALYPGYGFARHKGYGTAEHLAALARLGPSPQHRRSFKPVREAAAGAHGLQVAQR